MAREDGVEPPYHGSKPRTQNTVVLLPYVARLSGLSTIDEITAFGTLVRSAITQSVLVGLRSWTS